MSTEQFQALMLEPGYPRTKYSSPWTENGTVVVPGQIKNTAARRGVKFIVGFDELGTDGWAASNGRTKKEEVQEAILLYPFSDFWGEDEIFEDARGSDDNYFDGHRTMTDIVDMNLDSSYGSVL